MGPVAQTHVRRVVLAADDAFGDEVTPHMELNRTIGSRATAKWHNFFTVLAFHMNASVKMRRGFQALPR